MVNMTEHAPVIATHNSNFHADDVFAVAALKQLYPSAKVIRTRNLDELDQADIVLDVGVILPFLTQFKSRG
jgi:uncharacterized UPF0160 family protein